MIMRTFCGLDEKSENFKFNRLNMCILYARMQIDL